MYISLCMDQGRRAWKVSPAPEFQAFLQAYSRKAESLSGGRFAMHAFVGSADCEDVIMLPASDHPEFTALDDTLHHPIQESDIVVIYPSDSRLLEMPESAIEDRALWDMSSYLSRQVSGAFLEDPLQANSSLAQIAAACLLAKSAAHAQQDFYDLEDRLHRMAAWGVSQMMAERDIAGEPSAITSFFLRYPQIEIMIEEVVSNIMQTGSELLSSTQEICRRMVDIVLDANITACQTMSMIMAAAG